MRISGFENIICIEEFHYCLMVDEHESCCFLALVSEKHVHDCIDQMGKSCMVEGDGLKFRGTVTDITVTKGMDHYRVEAALRGQTLRLDLEQKCRVYQNSEKTISDMLSKAGISEIQVSAHDDAVIREVFVQDHETDWAFMKRLSKYIDAHIFPGENVRIGGPLNETTALEADDIIEMSVALRQGKSEVRCQLNKQLALGTKTSFYGKEFFVDTVSCTKRHEMYVLEYHLSECVQDRQYHCLPTYHLLAKVQGNDDPEGLGRVKLQYLEPYEDVMREEAMWVECASPWASKGHGLVCIPLVDDVVEVRIFDQQARVLSSRRVEAIDSRAEDPNTRYLLAGEHTQLSLNDGRIKLDNSKCLCEISDETVKLNFGQAVEIALDEKSIQISLDQSNVKIEGGRIIFSTDQTDMELSSETKLVTQGFEVDGKSHAAITASNVSIKGKSGVSIN